MYHSLLCDLGLWQYFCFLEIEDPEAYFLKEQQRNVKIPDLNVKLNYHTVCGRLFVFMRICDCKTVFYSCPLNPGFSARCGQFLIIIFEGVWG